MINEEILQQLAKEFKREDKAGSFEERRKDWWEKLDYDKFITREAIDQLSAEDALKLYKNTGWGVKLYPHTFIENGIERIKDSLQYLLYGDAPLEERFTNVVDPNGSYKIKGTGREFASFLLCVKDPQEYGIWNGAVDDGLKLLKMTPRRKRGEKVGETYIKVLQVLKKLQDKCGFGDLQITDEFIELIGHGLLGKELLKVRPKPKAPEEEAEEVPEGKIDWHTKIQWMLIKIGLLEGYDVWVANSDRGKSFNAERFSDLCLEELPIFAGPNVLQIAQAIDVIWFKKGTSKPEKFIEVEHTTSVYSGLLRLNDVITDYPISDGAIVAAEERRALFDRQINRRTFNVSGLAEVCKFLSYDQVEKLHEVENVRKELL